MRPNHPTPTAGSVHHLARHALTNALPWKPFRASVAVAPRLDLLLLMAAPRRPLFAVARRFLPFRHETARPAVHANLPNRDTLTAGLVRARPDVLALTGRDRRRRWTVAIDTHDRPDYGSRAPPGVGGPKKQGTQSFFRYATAVLVPRRRRYTVGLMPLTKSTPPHQVVAARLEQIQGHGLVMGGVVLDSGFDRGETILDRQRRGLNYPVPRRRKGSGTNRRNAGFAWSSGSVGSGDGVTQTTREAVSTRVLVWPRAGQPQAKVSAFAGWGEDRAGPEVRRAWLARRRYRERFGIETSYRQKTQARAGTTSRDGGYRLLLEGLAHLLRQVWVRLGEQRAHAGGLRPTAWIELRLDDVLESLADQIKALHPPQCPTRLLSNPLQRQGVR